MHRFHAALVLITTLVACGAVAAADPEAERKKFQGTWDIVAIEAGGVRTPAEKIGKGLQIEFNGDKMTLLSADEKKEDACVLGFKLDPARKPAAIDVTYRNGPLEGKTAPGIYVFDGATLKLCYAEDPTDEKDRPRAFTTRKGSTVKVYILKKAKP